MPIGDLLAQISGEPSPTQPNAPADFLPKRKANDELRRPVDKMQKTSPPSASRPVNTKPPAVSSSMAKMKIAPNGQTPSTSIPTAATFKNGQPTPPPSSDAPPAKAPKKGSFAEIMARAKAAQATSGQVGKIQHKRIEKAPSKREREEARAQKSQNLQKNLGPNGKFQKAGQSALGDGRAGMKESKGKVPVKPEVEKKVRKAATATTGYAGTARPKPGSAKAPSRSSVSGSRYDRGPDRHRDDRRGSSSRYTYASEDEDEAEEEEEYDSDASSDMEAAAFEVDEEEEAAARIARREDAEALAEENRLKQEKEEKRKRLVAMAKSRR